MRSARESRKRKVSLNITGASPAALDFRSGGERSTILCMLPDTGERYLSTPLFGDIQAEMNDEESAIAKSVPMNLPA